MNKSTISKFLHFRIQKTKDDQVILILCIVLVFKESIYMPILNKSCVVQYSEFCQTFLVTYFLLYTTGWTSKILLMGLMNSEQKKKYQKQNNVFYPSFLAILVLLSENQVILAWVRVDVTGEKDFV